MESFLTFQVMTKQIGALRPSSPRTEHWLLKFGRRELLRFDFDQMWHRQVKLGRTTASQFDFGKVQHRQVKPGKGFTLRIDSGGFQMW